MIALALLNISLSLIQICWKYMSTLTNTKLVSLECSMGGQLSLCFSLFWIHSPFVDPLLYHSNRVRTTLEYAFNDIRPKEVLHTVKTK